MEKILLKTAADLESFKDKYKSNPRFPRRSTKLTFDNGDNPSLYPCLLISKETRFIPKPSIINEVHIMFVYPSDFN